MPSLRKLTLATAAATALLGGCQTTNQYAGNFTTYNLEAEKSVDTAIVLNILRASKRRPLTFFDLQTVNGSNPASGSLGLALPLDQHGGSTASAASPTLNWSGGPTVAAGVINTQEFYQGVLKPVSSSTLDLFIQRGVKRDLLYNLMFSSIVFSKSEGVGANKKVVSAEFKNYPGNDDDVRLFQRLVEVLVDMDLTTAPEKSASVGYGPILFDKELINNDVVARSAAAGLAVKQMGWCDLGEEGREDVARRLGLSLPAKQASVLEANCASLAADDPVKDWKPADDGCGRPDLGEPPSEDVAAERYKVAVNALTCRVRKALVSAGWPTVFYQVQKPGGPKEPGLCFTGDKPDGLAKNTGLQYCGADKPHAILRPQAKPDKLCAVISEVLRERSPKELNLLSAGQREQGEVRRAAVTRLFPRGLDCKPGWTSGLSFEMTPRSAYGVIYYLGEVVRREHYADYGAPNRPILIRDNADSGGSCADQTAPTSACVPIFQLSRVDAKGRQFLHVPYEGAVYTLEDTDQTHKTAEVLDLVTELLALNRNAKDLPTSNVFTVRSGP